MSPTQTSLEYIIDIPRLLAMPTAHFQRSFQMSSETASALGIGPQGSQRTGPIPAHQLPARMED